jgi:hypothetical protein
MLPQELFDDILAAAGTNGVQTKMASNAAVRRSGTTSKEPSLLAGLLFDGNGNRMSPSHAVKNGKRYRYYISNNLIAGAKGGREGNAGDGLRIGAHEVEGHVVASITAFLADQNNILAELCPENMPPAESRAVLDRAQSLANRLSASSSGTNYEPIRTLIHRVRVDTDAIDLELSRRSVIDLLEISYGAHESKDGYTVQIRMPAELRRLGQEKRLIVAAHMAKTNLNPTLIKAIVRAHRWLEKLKACEVESIADLANTENVKRTYPSRIMPLAFLAPDITEAILEGRQPIDLSLERVLAASPLSLVWDAQRAALGFPSRK